MSFETKSDEEILAIAEPIMHNLMQASTELDYVRHVKDFTPRIKSIVTPEYFQKVCLEYQGTKGYFAKRIPVAVFKRPEATAIIWKQYFTKAKGEFVAEMLLVEQEGRYLVDHVMVF